MDIKSAAFLTSNSDPEKCPKPDKPEYALIGRSNVGKSSILNMLTGRKSLAKISSTPGKTQLINHFLIDDSWYLVDLPGYGWASLSKEKKVEFDIMNKEYLRSRVNLQCVFVLIDSRLPPQKLDLEFLRWVGKNEIPFILVFTKADKQSVNKSQLSVEAFKAELLLEWEALPQCILTSSVTQLGKDEILGFVSETNKGFERGFIN